MDAVMSKFSDVAIKHNGIILFKPLDAIKVVEECFELQKEIYGADAFIVNEPFIQPFMEHDACIANGLDATERKECFIKHLSKYIDSEFVFEVVYKGVYDGY